MAKILLNILTHGDELVGLKVAEEIKKRYPNIIWKSLDIQIANEEAYKKAKRQIDSDLNRVFPGLQNGDVEERRAFELKNTVGKYDLVIDVHSTESGSEDVVIVTKLDELPKKILESLSPKYVLFMNMKPDRSLISCAKIGICFEMGKDKDVETFKKTIQGVEKLLSHFKIISPKDSYGFKTQYFEVFSQIPKPNGAKLVSGIKNFSLIKKGEVFAKKENGEGIVADFDFYPVIFGSTNYETIFGFASRRLTL